MGTVTRRMVLPGGVVAHQVPEHPFLGREPRLSSRAFCGVQANVWRLPRGWLPAGEGDPDCPACMSAVAVLRAVECEVTAGGAA